MPTYSNKYRPKQISTNKALPKKTTKQPAAVQLQDKRPEMIAQKKLQEMADRSPQALEAAQLQAMADAHTMRLQSGINREALQGEMDNEKDLRKKSHPEKLYVDPSPFQPVVQRTLDDANIEAKNHGVEKDFPSRSSVIEFLKKKGKPKAGEGVDKIRSEFNRGIRVFTERISYTDIWPDEIPKEVILAMKWVSEFLVGISFESLLAKYQLTDIAETIKKMGKDRKNSGLDLLFKFMVYHCCGTTILENLLGNYSDLYKKYLDSELSSQLSIFGNTPVADEVFKEIPTGVDPQTVKGFGVESFLQPFLLGIASLQASIKKKYPIEVIVEYHFLHDKGYLNATKPLDDSTAAKYAQRLAAVQTQNEKAQTDKSFE